MEIEGEFNALPDPTLACLFCLAQRRLSVPKRCGHFELADKEQIALTPKWRQLAQSSS